jgi:hypothetical protein
MAFETSLKVTQLRTCAIGRQLHQDDARHFDVEVHADDRRGYISRRGCVDSVIVGQPEFFTAMSSLVQSTPVPTLKDYALSADNCLLTDPSNVSSQQRAFPYVAY